jgi:hypothetical protein
MRGVDPVLTQESARLDLQWVAFDPVDLEFWVKDCDWSGTYKAQVRAAPSRKSHLLDELTVVATYSAPDTKFTLKLADSSSIPNGGYWDLQEAGGPTRLGGRVIVSADVTT